jgi:hypothetical protein
MAKYFTPWQCDVGVPNSVMNNQWNADDLNDLNWLNFSVAHHQTYRNVNWRAYGASGWEVLGRSPNFDPRDGLRARLPSRLGYHELGEVAPAAGDPASIELPNSEARSALQIIWVDPPGAAQAVAATTTGFRPIVRSLPSEAILYPEAARLVATLSLDGEFIAKAAVSATVSNPDSSTSPLTFRDDGIAPDAQAQDGLYSALLLYHTPGLHHVSVTFTNEAGEAEYTYLGRHYTPGPNGETYDPAPSPVGQYVTQTAELDLVVSGFVAGSEGQVEPIHVTVDNADFPGRIDSAGDQDRYTFTAATADPLVVRVTNLAAGLQPRIRVYQDEPPVLIGEYTYLAQGNGYFFNHLAAEAGLSYLVEIEDVDPTRVGGLFNISVGPPLANSIETLTQHLYLPLVGR